MSTDSTRLEKCEAILKKILQAINEGAPVKFEYDMGHYTATISRGSSHTHVGFPEPQSEETFSLFVDNLYTALHGGSGLSWHTEEKP